jgi:hypothetical protein
MSYQQVSLGTLKARLADRYESAPYWSAEEARRALNEGLRIYSASCGFWRTAILTQTVPNDPFVALPGTLVSGSRVAWNDLPLEPASLFDFDYALPNWRAVTTATAGAPSRPVYWARVSLTLLAIYPADAFASVGGTHSLLINGVRNTPVLVGDADWVDLGQEQFDVLLGYAAHVLAFKLGGEALVSTYPGWLALLKAAALENRQFAESSFYRRVMGLDQLRREMPPEKAVQSVADAALSMGEDLQYPAQRVRG